MRNRIFMALALAATFLAGGIAHAQTSSWTIDPVHSSVNFEVRHLSVSNVHGSINGVKGTVLLNEKDLSKSSVQATADTTTVTTINEKRDAHLKSPDFFNVEKFPHLSFKSTSLTKVDGKLKLTGDLTLDDVTKPVTLDVDGPAPASTGQDGKTRSGFSATGSLKRSDFNFGQKFPSAVIGDEVKFTIDLEVDKQ